MKLSLEKAVTTDGYLLHGLCFEPAKATDTIIVHIHGSAGNFYQNSFYPYLFKMAQELNIAFLTTNNRGTGVYDIEKGAKYRGAAVETFKDCLMDIDAWLEFAFKRGCKHIILEGHSFGTNKIQFYALNGRHRKKVKALILMGFTDSYGGQLKYLKTVGLKNKDILAKAKQLIFQDKPFQLLPYGLINWGELPQAAGSYYNFMQKGSKLSKILPLSKKKELINFKKIKKPILGIVGDRNECTVIPPQQAVNMLNKQNPFASCFMIKNCNHVYEGKEKNLVKIIKKFIKKL
jgi:pimeloyl-ACP methyl ester carboxylesterase